MKVRCKICGKEYSNYWKECSECNRYQIDPNEDFDDWGIWAVPFDEEDLKWDFRKLVEYANSIGVAPADLTDEERDMFLFEKYKK